MYRQTGGGSSKTKSNKVQVKTKKGNAGKTKGKFEGKNIIFLGLMVCVIANVCYSAFRGVMAIETCKKDNDKILERNLKISMFSGGVAIGMGVYALIPSNLVSIPMNFFVAILVGTISALNVSAYQSLEDCKDKSKIQHIYAVMYGFLGFGVGVIFYALLSMGTKKLKNVTLVRAVLILAAIFCIVLSSFNLTTAGECKDTSPNLKKESIISLVISGLVFLPTLASFKYIKP